MQVPSFVILDGQYRYEYEKQDRLMIKAPNLEKYVKTRAYIKSKALPLKLTQQRVTSKNRLEDILKSAV